MSGFGSLLGMLLAVIIILFMAWWVTSLIARHGVAGMAGLTKMPGAAGAGELCVLRQIPVGRSERLLLVRLNERILLLGSAEGGVNLLVELTEAEAAPWLEASQNSGSADFRKLLHMSTKK